jgi:hypothetical protein
MGNVIPFGKKPSKPTQTPSGGGNLEKTIASLISGLENEFRGMGIEIDPALKIRAHLSSLRGHISANAIATARNMLRNSTLEELRAIAKNSNANQWSARPGYFQALCDEINARG